MPKRKSKTTSTASKSKDEEGNSDSTDNDDDEAAVLWKKLQATQRKKMKQLEADTEQLQTEKDTMTAAMTAPANIRDDDIITINAGGKLITALRSTLTIPVDSMWSYMFSGRWEESLKRDKDGNIFFDYDSELIEIIVNYLRMKKVEDPSQPLDFPHVPAHKVKDFQRLLQYFGLVDYFKESPATIIFSKSNFKQYYGRNYVTVTEEQHNKIALVYDNSSFDSLYCVACTTELDPSGEGCFWKATIEPSRQKCFIHFGIIGNLDLEGIYSAGGNIIKKDYFGWAPKGNVLIKGTEHKKLDGWTGFVNGECLYFHFKANKLSMHSVQKKKTFVIDGIDTNTKKFFFHFYMYDKGTAISLAPLNVEERKVFTE